VLLIGKDHSTLPGGSLEQRSHKQGFSKPIEATKHLIWIILLAIQNDLTYQIQVLWNYSMYRSRPMDGDTMLR
jgi:hypothetical protein